MAMRAPLPQAQSLDDIADEVSVPSRAYRRGHWAWTEQRRLQLWNPLGAPTAWMTAEVQDALDAIPEPHTRKKRCTVLRLAEARALGLGVRAVFDQEDTCNAVTWYGRKGDGWKDEPAIKEALEIATKRAQWWQDQEEAQRITMRGRQLAATQDELVDLSKLATETLADLMMNAGSEKVRLEAAETVLDRAAAETAKKLTVEADVTSGERRGPSMADIRRRQRQRGAQGDETDGAQGFIEETIGLSLPGDMGSTFTVTLPLAALPDGTPDVGDLEWVSTDSDD